MLKKARYLGKREEAMSLQYSKTNNKSLANVLKSISDDKSLSIFQAIADVNSNGKISCCTMITKNALKNYHNLKTVEATEDNGFPSEELSKLMHSLIDNQEVTEFLTKKC